MLLADAAEAVKSDGQIVLLMSLSGILGGAVLWLANFITDRRKMQRSETKDDEETAIQRLEKLLARVDADRKETKEENVRLQKAVDEVHRELTSTKVLAERAITWIRYLEASLELAKIPFRPWVDSPPAVGSSTHAPLPNKGS